MSEASQEETPFHLTGNFAPVFDERTELALEVVGTIPPELNGRSGTRSPRKITLRCRCRFPGVGVYS